MGTIILSDELVEHLGDLYEQEIIWCEIRDIVFEHTFDSYVADYLRREGEKLK